MAALQAQKLALEHVAHADRAAIPAQCIDLSDTEIDPIKSCAITQLDEDEVDAPEASRTESRMNLAPYEGRRPTLMEEMLTFVVDVSDDDDMGSAANLGQTESTEPHGLAEAPHCPGHGEPCRRVEVKKEGPNKGRHFFACARAREEQCKFFAWADIP
eukprot:2016378-Amphidinium_carterae.1